MEEIYYYLKRIGKNTPIKIRYTSPTTGDFEQPGIAERYFDFNCVQEE